ncbi:MFS transporter [Streptacidiphilus carbonis]|jgi:predicted MFS family arabinose efflux permease|uniref:MFS transporter n=1 Tax=Streptacidiphilus carbonis TaxID=105422 RepID=UPI000693C33B|nr:MFS transporter [Streptacidiphilus carbonis]
MSAPAARLARAALRLLPDQGIRLLVAIQLIDAVGTGVFLSGSAVIYYRVFGFSPGTIGLAVGLAGAAGLGASMVGGVLVDRVGARRALVLLTAAQALTYLAFLLVHGFAAFAALLCLIAVIDYTKGTAYTAVLAGQLQGRPTAVRSRAVIRSYFNAGFFGGSSAAALLIGVDRHWLLRVFVGANALSYVLCAGLVLLLPRLAAAERKRTRRRFSALRDRRFLGVVLVTSVLGLHGAILTVALPLWILKHTSVSPSLVPALLALNTILAVTAQVPMARGTDGLTGAARAARQSSGLVAAGCLALACTAGIGGPGGGAVTVVAVVAITAGELRQTAGRWGLSFALAPADARAEYLGAFNICLALTAIYGAPLTVWLTTGLGAPGWCLLAVLVLGAGMLITPAARGAGSSADTAGLLDVEVAA